MQLILGSAINRGEMSGCVKKQWEYPGGENVRGNVRKGGVRKKYHTPGCLSLYRPMFFCIFILFNYVVAFAGANAPRLIF